MKIRKILFGVALFVTYSISAQIPTNGLIAEYLFENNLNDTKSSGTPYNLSIIQGNASYFDGSGATGKSLYLDGATKINNTDQNFVTFINNKNPWTINFWFKYKTGLKPVKMGADALISIDYNGSPYKRIWIQTYDYLNCELANNNYGGTVSLTSTNKINDDRWHFASISQDGDSTRMYIDNGIRSSKLSKNFGLEPLEAFVLGSVSQSDWASRDFYIGYLDQVRVYNRALSKEEMNSLYFENKCVETIYDTTHVTIFDTIPLNTNIPSNGLVAYYPFNGNANDLSGNLNNGTVFGASLTSDRFGISNSAYSFDGDKNYIEIQPSPSINTAAMDAISISAWFNLDGYNNFNRIVSFMNKSINQNLDLCISTNVPNPEPSDYNQVVFQNFTGAADNPIVWGKAISLQKWYHVVSIMDYSNNTAYLYVNDEFIGSGTGTAVKPDNPFMDIGCLVGSIPTWLAFNGKIDDVRVYNRKLETDEIKSLYYEGKCFESVYDTVHIQVFDTIPVYEKIAVTDTLIINAVLTGIEPPLNQNTIKAYPNPTKDRITIDNGDYTKMAGYQLKIINSSGTMVFESEINAQMFDLDLNTFGGKGTYFLQVVDDSSQIIDIKKIILQ